MPSCRWPIPGARSTRAIARSAAALGVSPARVLWRLRLPLLLRPLLFAFAIGCAVSVGQYLPTLFAGAGRIATLTTEAVTLSSGADRRIMGVYTFLQAGIPLLVYAAALAIPAALFMRRRGMNDGAAGRGRRAAPARRAHRACPAGSSMRSLSIDVAAGEIVTVMGASGSGKSSLLAFIGGYLAAPFTAEGEVSIGARPLNGVPPHAATRGHPVPGRPALSAPVGRRQPAVRAARRRSADARARRSGDRAGACRSAAWRATASATRRRCRAASVRASRCMRTLLAAPRILLLDEPFGKLDAALRDDLRRFVFGHAIERGLPTLLVTHDVADAQAAGGRVVTLA